MISVARTEMKPDGKNNRHNHPRKAQRVRTHMQLCTSSDLPSDGATVVWLDTIELMMYRGVRGGVACAPVD